MIWLMTAGAGSVAQEPAGDSVTSIPADIPVPPGFDIDIDASLIFDKPGGRIVQIEMTGRDNWPAVRRFFLDSLAQLGWRQRDAATDMVAMTRGPEEVTIVPVSEAEALRLRFEIKPRSR